MHFTYVLRSERDRRLYIGLTTNIARRIAQHNDGTTTSTKSRRPLTLLYYEAHCSPEDAKRRERYFKTAKGKATLRQILRDSLAKLAVEDSG